MPLGQDIPAPCRLTMHRGGAKVEGNFSVYDSSIRRMFSQKPCHLYHSPLFLSTIDCRKWGLSSLTNFVGDDYSHFYTAFGHLWTIMHGDILLWGLLASCIMSAKRNMNIPDDLSFFGATLSYQHSTLFDSSVLLPGLADQLTGIFATLPLTLDVNSRGSRALPIPFSHH